MKEDIKIVGSIIGLVIFIVIVFLVAGNMVNEYKCESYSRISGKETYYNNFDICYVEGKRWDEYIASQTASSLKE
jgi:hypothetical protein